MPWRRSPTCVATAVTALLLSGCVGGAGGASPAPRPVDPCEALQNGQHLTQSSTGEVIAARTCADGATVGYCDIEVTRHERPISLERCETAKRYLNFSSNLRTADSVLGFRIGGLVREVDYAALNIKGIAELGPGTRLVPFLSGPFEPRPEDRFVVLQAEELRFAEPPDRVPLPSGASFACEIVDNAVVLTDYRPPPGGRHYEPVRVEPGRKRAPGNGRTPHPARTKPTRSPRPSD